MADLILQDDTQVNTVYTNFNTNFTALQQKNLVVTEVADQDEQHFNHNHHFKKKAHCNYLDHIKTIVDHLPNQWPLYKHYLFYFKFIKWSNIITTNRTKI